MSILPLVIGAALAGTPLPSKTVPADASLQAPLPKAVSPASESVELAKPPGPDVMRAIELPLDLCLSARCVTV